MPVTFAAPRNQCACGVSAGTHALTVFNQCAGDVSPDPAADAERKHAPAAHAAPGKLVPEAHALTVFKQRARAESAKTLPTLPSRPTATARISNKRSLINALSA